jgi:Transposase DDE domain
LCLRKLAAGDRAVEVAFGHFLANPKVTLERLIEGWSDQTRTAVAGRHVLAIQDTSEIHFSTRPKHRRGLGVVGKGNARGILAHVMVAVDADNGACLGLAAGSIYNRKNLVRVSHAKRALEDKESKRWLETPQASKPVLAAADMVTVLGDRENDIFAYWAMPPEPNFHLLARMMRDRGVAGGGTVWNTTAHWPFVAARRVKLSATPGRAARTATLGLRFGEVEIIRPKGKDTRRLPKTVKLRLIEVVESDPPAGVEPVHWRLLTTHAVDDVAMAWQIVDWYRLRWIIEQLFRLMKSDGLKLEDSQLETAEALMKLTAVAAKAACVILQLVQARDSGAEPAANVFSQTEIAVLDHLNKKYDGKTKLQNNPHARHSLTWASWIIARLGGWNGYPSSRPPGPITMRNGWEFFRVFASGWQFRDMCIL